MAVQKYVRKPGLYFCLQSSSALKEVFLAEHLNTCSNLAGKHYLTYTSPDFNVFPTWLLQIYNTIYFIHFFTFYSCSLPCFAKVRWPKLKEKFLECMLISFFSHSRAENGKAYFIPCQTSSWLGLYNISRRCGNTWWIHWLQMCLKDLTL